jgi:hypothetical protein
VDNNPTCKYRWRKYLPGQIIIPLIFASGIIIHMEDNISTYTYKWNYYPYETRLKIGFN